MADEQESAASEGRGEGFLARWSRRKRAAREGLPVDAEPAAAPSPETPLNTTPPQAAEEEPVDLDQLPKIEEITAETDISVFFRRGVPAALRNAALRKAWSLDPTIRDFIGPADYAWDWNTPGGVPDFVDGVGETPAIRALVERMFSPSPPVRRESEAEAPAPLAAAEDHRDLPDPVRPPGAPPPLPLAAHAEPDRPGSAMGDTPESAEGATAAPEVEPSPPPAAPPRRHGGALPV